MATTTNRKSEGRHTHQAVCTAHTHTLGTLLYVAIGVLSLLITPLILTLIVIICCAVLVALPLIPHSLARFRNKFLASSPRSIGVCAWDVPASNVKHITDNLLQHKNISWHYGIWTLSVRYHILKCLYCICVTPHHIRSVVMVMYVLLSHKHFIQTVYSVYIATHV